MQDKIQEIMGLVDIAVAEAEDGQPTFGYRCQIGSKLRALVREQSTPMQPIILDSRGVTRFKKNTIVDNLYEHGVRTGYGFNEMYTENHDDEDRMQFAQLIGYSVSGYSTLSYVTDESVNAAFAIAESITNTSEKKQEVRLTEAQSMEYAKEHGIDLHRGEMLILTGKPAQEWVDSVKAKEGAA